MLLTLDVGNTHIHIGLFQDDQLIFQCRYPTNQVGTSDQIGVFLRAVLRENALDSSQIQSIAIGSVVPHVDYSLTAACQKYFKITPFVLKAGVKTGLKIKCQQPQEIGADLIASSVAATQQFSKKNIVIIDFGTATSVTAVNANHEFLGASFMPGPRLAVKVLQENTAKLPEIDIIRVNETLGKNTLTAMQTGIFWQQLGGVREIVEQIEHNLFAGQNSITLATGGFAQLFSQHTLFDRIIPDLTLQGLKTIFWLNQHSFYPNIA